MKYTTLYWVVLDDGGQCRSSKMLQTNDQFILKPAKINKWMEKNRENFWRKNLEGKNLVLFECWAVCLLRGRLSFQSSSFKLKFYHLRSSVNFVISVLNKILSSQIERKFNHLGFKQTFVISGRAYVLSSQVERMFCHLGSSINWKLVISDK